MKDPCEFDALNLLSEYKYLIKKSTNSKNDQNSEVLNAFSQLKEDLQSFRSLLDKYLLLTEDLSSITKKPKNLTSLEENSSENQKLNDLEDADSVEMHEESSNQRIQQTILSFESFEMAQPVPKKIKLKISNPDLSSFHHASHLQPKGTKTLRQPFASNESQSAGFGRKNLSRMKELSKRIATEAEGSKSKTENQIPIGTFWSFVDPFFEPITEEDFAFLKEQNLPLDLFLIPQKSKNALSTMPSLSFRIISALIESEDLCIQPLKQNLSLPSEMDYIEEPLTDLSAGYPQLSVKIVENVPDLEQRITDELSALGITMENFKFNALEHRDEFYLQLKCLHYQLRTANEINRKRKNILINHLRSLMATQEYYMILDELDKQIEILFNKKFKNIRKKKRSSSFDLNAECQDLFVLMNKRNSLVENFKTVVKPRSFVLNNPVDLLIDGEVEAEIAAKYCIPNISDKSRVHEFGLNSLRHSCAFKLWP